MKMHGIDALRVHVAVKRLWTSTSHPVRAEGHDYCLYGKKQLFRFQSALE